MQDFTKEVWSVLRILFWPLSVSDKVNYMHDGSFLTYQSIKVFLSQSNSLFLSKFGQWRNQEKLRYCDLRR